MMWERRSAFLMVHRLISISPGFQIPGSLGRSVTDVTVYIVSQTTYLEQYLLTPIRGRQFGCPDSMPGKGIGVPGRKQLLPSR
jgi:hypothetical protein